jgi:hypothetical protein
MKGGEAFGIISIEITPARLQAVILRLGREINYHEVLDKIQLAQPGAEADVFRMHQVGVSGSNVNKCYDDHLTHAQIPAFGTIIGSVFEGKSAGDFPYHLAEAPNDLIELSCARLRTKLAQQNMPDDMIFHTGSRTPRFEPNGVQQPIGRLIGLNRRHVRRL